MCEGSLVARTGIEDVSSGVVDMADVTSHRLGRMKTFTVFARGCVVKDGAGCACDSVIVGVFSEEVAALVGVGARLDDVSEEGVAAVRMRLAEACPGIHGGFGGGLA